MALTLPYLDTALLIRTDFSDDQAWHEICVAALAPSPEGFRAGLECIDDERFEGLTVEQAVSISPVDQEPFFVFLVDRVALEHADRPILAVDLQWDPGHRFRVVPSAMASVENNLSISNMDFEEFSDCVDANGIFRGFE